MTPPHPLNPNTSDWDADLAYDRIFLSLQTGCFGDTEFSAETAGVLVELLSRLKWRVNARSLNAAMPHLPEQFGLTEIRDILHHLGYSTQSSEQPGAVLKTLPHTTLIQGADGTVYLLAPDGGLLDPGTGKVYGIAPDRHYQCVFVDVAENGNAERTPPILNRILLRFQPEIRHIFLLTLLTGALVLVASKSVAFIFNMVLPAQALDTLSYLLVGLVGLLLFDLSLRHLKAKLVARVSGRLEFWLATEIYDKLTHLPVELISGAPISDQTSRLRQFETVRDFFTGPISQIGFDLPFVAILMTMVLIICWPVALFVTMIMAALALAAALATPRLSAAGFRLSASRSTYQRLLDDALRHCDQMVRRGLAAPLTRRIAESQQRKAEAQFDIDRVLHLLRCLGTSAGYTAMVGTILIGANQAMSGAISAGELIVCMLLVTRLIGPVQLAVVSAVQVPDILRICRDIDRLLNLPTPNIGSALVAPDPDHVRSSQHLLRLEAVSFRYSAAAHPALAGLDVTLPADGLTCIRGTSGAGKSTLLRLIAGMHRPQAGRVCLGPTNLDQLSATQRSDLIGYLGEEPYLIHGTVAQNLRLTNPCAPIAQMTEICEELGLMGDISSLSNGFDTRLDLALRMRLSPSFRTRLCLARMLLQDPVFLLADDQIAALSPNDEALMLAALNRRRGRMTTLLVTERPSVLSKADQVLIMQDGRGRMVECAQPDNRKRGA